MESVIRQAIQDALKTPLPSSSPKVSQASKRPRLPWPEQVSVSVLAWVTVKGMPPRTAICAIGVGSQHDRPATAQMQAGTAFHNALLPHVAERLREYNPLVEFRVSSMGLAGRIDLLLPRVCAVELKTTTTRSASGIGDYNLVQAGLYHALICLPVYLALVEHQTRTLVSLHTVDSSETATPALALLREYQSVASQRPTPPVGECGLCIYKDVCEARNNPLCPSCLRPIREEDVAWVGEMGVHTCGQALQRHRDSIRAVQARGGRVVAKPLK